MTREGVRALCFGLPGVTMTNAFGPEHEVFKVGGKMFAITDDNNAVSFKVSDIAYEMLTEEGRARPAPYMAKAKWVKLDSLDAWPDDELTDYLANAHKLVAAKLTKKARAELGL